MRENTRAAVLAASYHTTDARSRLAESIAARARTGVGVSMDTGALWINAQYNNPKFFRFTYGGQNGRQAGLGQDM
jgi:hypothetical protein